MGTSERKEFNTKHNTNITDYVNMIINLCVYSQYIQLFYTLVIVVVV